MPNKTDAELFRATTRQPKRDEERKTSTKTQKWYSVDIYILHRAQKLKYIYIQVGEKPGQITPTEQHKRLMKNEKEQENSISITEGWKKGPRGPQ